MDIGITAIGTATPDYKRPQAETAELLAELLNASPAKKRVLKSIYQATGIDYRHSVLSDYHKTLGNFEFFPNQPHEPFPSTAQRMKMYEKHALPLALKAIADCFSEGRLPLTDITHVITVSCTGMYAPGLDIEIVQSLSLNTTVQRTAINFMGCYGAFNALKVADAICKTFHNAKVLMVSIELCTLHLQKNWTLDNIIANAIFADGAAAALIEANPTPPYLSLSSFYCDLIPQTSKEMAWHIADQGFDILLSSYVPDVIEAGIKKFAANLLQQRQLSLANIDFFAIHPGGSKILAACETALQIQPVDNKYSYEVLRNYGNMSSATILFVLKQIWQTLAKTDHQKNIFSCAFGPGLTLESMLLTAHCV